MKIAIPKFYISEFIDKEILENFYKIKEMLEENGAIVDMVDIKYINYSVPL